MSSQRRSKPDSGLSLGNTAAGILILLVPLASIWYFFRSSTSANEYERAYDDTSSEDEDLAYGSDTESSRDFRPDEKKERAQTITAVTLDSSSVPTTQSLQQLQPVALAVAASGAGALSAALENRVRFHFSPPSPGPGAELVNAGTMQVKGIRSVRGGATGDYMSRD
ncbi:hypothetical protein IQ06DRAFT_295258 [Phaeosphaeriaceae sp. SRC1lsM3a]|nr:hypothetical protein IQ06DRAFT_295258 [Stagonospora sp. SRC1lsM3a]